VTKKRESLRDKFAIAALNGFLARGEKISVTGIKNAPKEYARISFLLADAMMEATAK